MIDMGVDSAHVWPIQHKTPNSIAGNPDGTGTLKPTGVLFQMLSDSLRSQNETAPMKILDLTINDDIAGYETIGFQNDHKTVLYIASRNGEFAQFDIERICIRIKVNYHCCLMIICYVCTQFRKMVLAQIARIPQNDKEVRQ